MKKNLPTTLLLFTLLFAWSDVLFSQCPSGWNAATINWDQLDYITRNGTYSAFVTAAMRDTQYFAIGVNRLKIQLNHITTNGENTTNTAEGGSYGSGADVEYGGTGSIAMTFDTVVHNLQFSLYDIDRDQRIIITATDALGNALPVTMVASAGGVITVSGSGTNTAVAEASGTGTNNNDSRGTVNIDIDGNDGVRSVTITSSGASGNFWLSDITACVYGAFPLNYYVSQKPFAGQPAYYLVTPDNNSVYLFNPLTGVADWLFSEPESPWVNSMAYDHEYHVLYYVRDNPSPKGTNKALKKYDFNTETVGVVVEDLGTLGIPLYDIVVESAGAAFYNGSLYLGIEGTNDAKNSSRESIIWRIDFDAARNPVKVCQVFARPADNGSGTLTHDWGDFTIKDGILYDFNTGNVGSTSQFVHYDMQNGDAVFYNTNGSPAPIQAGQTWDGRLYWTGGQYPEQGRVALYNENGTIGQKITATVTACSPAWQGRAGDASDPFRPKSDFGDAPASYDPDGVDPATHEYHCNLRLGPRYDREWNKTISANATADGDDEDGITTVTLLATGTMTFVQDVRVYNNTGSSARLVAWLDYDGDGVFEAGEGVVRTVPSRSFTQTVTLNWPNITVDLPAGATTFLRLRLSTSSGLGVTTPNGWFANGEVEDYMVVVDGILPVRLKNFTANDEQNERVLLYWTTENEYHFKGFEIERSADGDDWEKIGFAASQGNGSLNTYQWYDNNPLPGKSQYRLKMIDQDGKVKYSWIVMAELQAAFTGLRVLPNPVRDQARIRFTAARGEKAEIRVIDASGKRMLTRPVVCNDGVNQVVLDIPASYAPGLYVVQVITSAGRQQAKMLVGRN